MSTWAKELVEDLLLDAGDQATGLEAVSPIDESPDQTKAWVTVTLPSRERFFITVERLS